jgi:pimeloyl-ACP methyl ester carboxylesterase
MRNVDDSLSGDVGDERFHALPVPTTIVQGTADWMVPAAASLRYFERLRAPRKRFAELNDVGHYPFVQAPGQFAQVLENGLA